MQSGTVVQKWFSDPNRRLQPNGVSKQIPESKRSLYSRTAIAKRNAGSIRSQEPNCSLEQQSQTESQCRYTESYKKTQLLSFFCIGAVTPTELTLRQGHNHGTNRNAKAKFQCFGGCCNRCYIPHWRRLLNILYQVWMFPCQKNYSTQPVCRRVTLNRRFRWHDFRLHCTHSLYSVFTGVTKYRAGGAGLKYR